MKTDISKISYEFLDNAIVVQEADNSIRIMISEITDLHIFRKNSLNKFLGNLFLKIDFEQDGVQKSVSICALHNKWFNGAYQKADGEDSWNKFASKLYSKICKFNPKANIQIGRMGTVLFNRIFFGSIITGVILLPIIVWFLWWTELASITHPWMVLPGCLALGVFCFLSNDSIIHAFRRRKFVTENQNFENILKLM